MSAEPSRRMSCEDDACWVCLEAATEASPLEHPCQCPRGVHAKCLARWQLQSAGREEERLCRFCKHTLPDWRSILKTQVPAAAPTMAIVYNGKVVRLQVKPGREGMEEFQRQVRTAFDLGEDVELDCVFDCRAPGTGEKIKLRGLESYSAAMHCAAVAAGERLAKMGPGTAAGPGADGGRSSSGPSGSGSPSASSSAGGSTSGAVAIGTTPAAAAGPGSSGSSTAPSPSAPSGRHGHGHGQGQAEGLAHAQAACHLPGAGHAGLEDGEACGGGASASRRKSPAGLFSGLLKSLASARRVC
ncbi:hypothetical protein HYH03_005384 [Edaphochlamys debaryana]|uniref:RING-CH-type domain-containing protein n=1 Tax=Edaphochlamys debaryana TaxID=47281 RepID=A0A835Y5U4_9CHLO|nr:hypothetical protein HYH03_005384 [Edaphochlamys debaryana]|eukprot:KAG2496561.1 hypothetical protein HYH03_005384 [Edaphochlamys debaryana]